ncbi:MAG: branched-chain amino acid ABC transporter permease [Desulfomonile tiedjei]|uniref:Branched-chain amino acid ABC transporter permease n=1 Tax=Desulfomonile tiedjei TaxID=2358 RepID=A0A9D6Z487_9BACT|nr:branched-chain amino acid ABC transporter permease [Desulfomonile tiedjei]
MKSNWKYIIVALMLLVLIGIGYFSSRFVLYLAMKIMILSIFAMGYNILFGRTGLLSFGHAAFYATGAYGVALCSMHVHTHPLVGIMVGIAAAAFLALIIGFFCVRHTEIYFAMLTLAFGMMVFSLMWNLRDITGGDDGLSGIMRGSVSLGFLKISITKDSQFYFLVLFFFALSMLLVHRIYQSPFGLVLAGIRENHVRTEFAGLGVKRYRLAAFVVSGAFAGLAGALGLLLESNVTPFAAHWSHSANPVLVSLMGGLQTFSGPIVGSIVFVLLREFIERFTHNWMLWFGVILLAIILGFRGGIVGSTTQLVKRLSKVS